MVLVAKWLSTADNTRDAPSEIFWSDGRPATMDDYLMRLDRTHTVVRDPQGTTQVIYLPNLFVVTYCDTNRRVWRASPQAKIFDLFSNDPSATDDIIVSDLSSSSIVYELKPNQH